MVTEIMAALAAVVVNHFQAQMLPLRLPYSIQPSPVMVLPTVLGCPSVVDVAGGFRGGVGLREGCLSTAMCISCGRNCPTPIMGGSSAPSNAPWHSDILGRNTSPAQVAPKEIDARTACTKYVPTNSY